MKLGTIKWNINTNAAEVKLNAFFECQDGLTKKDILQDAVNQLNALYDSISIYDKPPEKCENTGWFQVKDLAQGMYFKRKENSAKVYSRGPYDRSYKTYGCGDESDISREINLKGSTLVFIDFEY